MREPACLQIPLLAVKTGQPPGDYVAKKKSPLLRTPFKSSAEILRFGGPDETRTRDPMRDRHVF